MANSLRMFIAATARASARWRIVLPAVLIGMLLGYYLAQKWAPAAATPTHSPAPPCPACPVAAPVVPCPTPAPCPASPPVTACPYCAPVGASDLGAWHQAARALKEGGYTLAMRPVTLKTPGGVDLHFTMTAGLDGEMGNNRNGMEVAVLTVLEAAWKRVPAHELIFLDVGANLGWFSTIAGTLGVRTVAFDPQPECAARNRFNVLLNGLETVEVRNAAVSAHTTALLKVNRAGCAGLFAYDLRDTVTTATPKAGAQEATVPMISLDAATANLTGKRFVIKVDTEGSEVDVLRSAADLLAQPSRVADLVVELLPREWHKKSVSVENGTAVFDALVRQHNYNIYAVWDSTPYGSAFARRIPAPPFLPPTFELWRVMDMGALVRDRLSRNVGCNLWITREVFRATLS